MRLMMTSERDQTESFPTFNSYSAVTGIYIKKMGRSSEPYPPNQDTGIQEGQNNGSDRMTDIKKKIETEATD